MSAISLGKNEFVGIRLHLELGFGCLVMAFPETVSVLMLDMMSVRTAPDTLECCLIYANSVEEIGFSTLTLRISCEVGLWLRLEIMARLDTHAGRAPGEMDLRRFI